MALNEKLDYLQETKSLMKQALIEKGQEVPDDTTFRQYVEKILAIKTGDDLREQLDNQDEIIQQLQTALENKTAGGKPNIFIQLEEPSTKNGVWFKSDKTYDNIETANKAVSDTFTWNTSKPSIPYNFYVGSVVSVGTEIYLFGGYDSYSSDIKTYCYKYDILTNTYTRMTDIPYNFYEGSAVSVGTDIYLLGGSGNKTTCYKYDTLTDSYTQMTDIPYTFYTGSATSVGTDIYLFGGAESQNRCYKYDTLTESYTKMTDIPYSFFRGSVASVGTDIYLFDGYNYKNNCYKYDTLTDSYTRMAYIPYNVYGGSAVSVGTDIYLLGGTDNISSDVKTYCYKYDTLTDSYTQMTNIPYNFYYGSAALAGIDIYLFGGNDNKTKVQVMEFPVLEFEDKTVLIQNGTGLKTELVSTNIINGLKNEFKDTYYYTTEGKLNLAIPTYIGNGTSWNKIRGGAE